MTYELHYGAVCVWGELLEGGGDGVTGGWTKAQYCYSAHVHVSTIEQYRGSESTCTCTIKYSGTGSIVDTLGRE